MTDVKLHTIEVNVDCVGFDGSLQARVDTLMKVGSRGPDGVFAVARQQSSHGELYVLDGHADVCAPVFVHAARNGRTPRFCRVSGDDVVKVPMFPYELRSKCHSAALASLGLQLARSVWFPGVSEVYLLVSGLFSVADGLNSGKAGTHVYAGVAARRVG